VSAVDRALLAIKSAARRLGVELLRFNPTNSLDAARPLVLRDQGVDLVVDVGANEGQWARELRAEGYKGTIVSFEPLSAAYARLTQAARADAAWIVHRRALGDHDGEGRLNVAGNAGASSSLLTMAESHERAAPDSRYIAQEIVPVSRLDALELPAGKRLMLKLDVQGAERAVLAGAQATLERVRIIECELSLVELYGGQALMGELVQWLGGMGFALWGLRPGLADGVRGQLLQADGLFVRDAPQAGLAATHATAP
jgi:FkbM family methyltransferase